MLAKEISIFPTWKTITVGSYTDFDNLLNDLRDRNVDISRHVRKEIFKSDFKLSNQRRALDLVIVSGSDLGFTENVMYCDIISSARKHNLIPCSTEIALHVCRTETEKRDVSAIITADKSLFLVIRYKNKWKLRLSAGSRQDKWNFNQKFVFQRKI